SAIDPLNEAPHLIPPQITAESYSANQITECVFTQPGSKAAVVLGTVRRLMSAFRRKGDQTVDFSLSLLCAITGCEQAQQKNLAYSMTSSARASSEGGTVRPRAFAVFILMISSNCVGCSTGRSPGLAPFRILST